MTKFEVARWMREYTFWAYTEDDPVMNAVSVSHSTCLWSWEVKTLPEAIHAVLAHHLSAHSSPALSGYTQTAREGR